jgi:phosphatidylinositol alpha-1,6-mannosyltransferase
MNICFLTHNLRQDNGGGVFASRIIESVAKAGNEVVALTTLSSGKAYEQQLLPPGKTSLFSNFFAIRTILKSADIIHAFDAYPYGVIAHLATLGLHKKILITAIGTGSIGGLYHWPKSIFLRLAYRHTSLVTAISSFVRSEIEKYISNVPIRVITPGVEMETFAAPVPPTTLARKPYILSVGSLRWRKGYKFSIQGFAEIHQTLPELNYVIVGKRYTEKEYGQLKELIMKLDLKEHVTILETIDSEEEMCALYQGAEAFCLLSQNDNHDVEGFGLVFLEAAAAGLPVVGSTECGVQDAMQDGVNGHLVPSRDTHAFAEAMLEILQTPGVREKMSQASRLHAQENTWEKFH